MQEVIQNENPDEIELQPIYPPSVKNKLARTACLLAVGIEPLFSAFIWQSLRDAAEKAIVMFGGTVNQTAKNYIFYIAIPFAAVNLISDLTSVDPLRDADELTAPSLKEEEYAELSKRALGFFIKVLAVVTSFPVGGAADALPISEFMTKYIPGEAGNILVYSSLSIIVPLSIIYYMMFNNAKIQKHSNAFIDTVKHPVEFIQKLYHNPGRYLEVYIQSMTNALYRGVIFGYVMESVGQDIFKLEKNNPYLFGATITTGVSTFLVTLFSRLLNTKDRFLNPKFDAVTEKEWSETSGLRKSLIYDAVLSLIRGGALGILLSEAIPLQPILKYGIPAVSGSLAAAHSLYVRYLAGRYENALELKRHTSAINIEDHLEDNKAESKTELDKLFISLPSIKGTAEITQFSLAIDRIKYAPELFDKIVAAHDSPGLDFVIDSINFTARFTKFVAFFLFIDVFNWIFPSIKLSPLGAIALVFLLGAEVFKNDCDMFKDALQSAWRGFAAKWQLENEGGDKASYSCFSGTFFRPARVAFKSLYDYPYELLQDVAHTSERESNLQVQ